MSAANGDLGGGGGRGEVGEEDVWGEIERGAAEEKGEEKSNPAERGLGCRENAGFRGEPEEKEDERMEGGLGDFIGCCFISKETAEDWLILPARLRRRVRNKGTNQDMKKERKKREKSN